MYEAFENFIDLYLSEFIVAILLISILIVVMSIFHVIMTSSDSKQAIDKKIQPARKTNKETKIKYSKEFLSRVQGIDLDLKKHEK